MLDEADATILDDTTQYRSADNLNDVGDPSYNPFEWVYEHINEFIESAEFNDPEAKELEDIDNLRDYLKKMATPIEGKTIDLMDDRQLDTWINSAVAARYYHKDKENGEKKSWVLVDGVKGGEPVSLVKLMDNNRVVDSTWGKGVQQLNHARINKEIKEGASTSSSIK